MKGLAVSEWFYSVQGEGATVGVPSVFLRLKGCNLTCGGKNTVKSNKLDSGATWRCDTIEVWLTGKLYKHKELFCIFEQENYIESLKKGAHLIITGGEPLLQDNGLVCFFEEFQETYDFLPFIEIETNGTISASDKLDKFITQYNVSLKLKNSGMDKTLRIIENSILFYLSKQIVVFKFVVSSEKDVQEVFDNYVNKYNFPLKNIYLMPGATSRNQLHQLEQDIINLCKKKCVNYSTRLHIHVWDRLTGV